MQFGFVPGFRTKDSFFILAKLREKYLTKRKDLYCALDNFQKAFE